MFETQKSGNKTSSVEIGLEIRIHASPELGQDKVFGRIMWSDFNIDIGKNVSSNRTSVMIWLERIMWSDFNNDMVRTYQVVGLQ